MAEYGWKAMTQAKCLNTIADYSSAMVTTIQISEQLQKELRKRKINPKDSYEDIIWDILEDTMELSEETKKRIAVAEEQIRKGQVYTLEQVKKRLRLR